MMPESIILKGALGLNNKIDPLRHKYNPDTGVGFLAEAINCDIDDSGMISRRSGQELVSAISSHSVFCDKGDCFIMQDRESDAALYQVGTDFSLSGIRSGMTKGARVSFCQVGDKTYYSNYYQNGVIEDGVSSSWPPLVDHVGANSVRAFYPAPIGGHIAYFQNRWWIARDNEIFISEPNASGKFDFSRRYLQFGSNVAMIKPVAGGVWISDLAKTGFIAAGDRFKDMKYIKKASFPAHEWSDNIELVDLSNTMFEIPGLSAVWSCDAGLCIGSSDGNLTRVTEEKLIYPTGATGATIVDNRNVINSVY